MDNLFEPVTLNDTITLKNRIVMAPLTRCMADENLVPTQQMADYYARRAETGLIISEAVIIRPDGQGYPNTPGLFTAKQVEGWKAVTQAVHRNGGKIFAQLWHTGRVAHPHFFGGETVAPSAIAFEGSVPRMRELTYVVPKALNKQEIEQLVLDYAQAASNAIEAGFDGVEIHGANGYLIDQFLHYNSNIRTDEYGSTPENMTRFPLQVIDAIIEKIGGHRTALRLSPGAYVHIDTDPRDRAVFDLFLSELDKRDIAYIHGGIFDDSMEFDYLGGTISNYLRSHSSKILIGVGSYDAESGSKAIEKNQFDLLAIGRPLIANPDYVEKVKLGKQMVEYSEEMLAELV
ncbi:alkene reductase [Vibrio sp. S4M6]|uniref:alkene reductase n=1 Tax=Vibrio sinus TaxID=2946865 RepID=UPI00202AA433|nr:alkene reductase [Vibrio sinus]MCL9782004.1 alkene reductase [Vibrio sinus]